MQMTKVWREFNEKKYPIYTLTPTHTNTYACIHMMNYLRIKFTNVHKAFKQSLLVPAEWKVAFIIAHIWSENNYSQLKQGQRIKGKDIRLRKLPSISILLTVFIMYRCWILSLFSCINWYSYVTFLF